jgi:restriction system protein
LILFCVVNIAATVTGEEVRERLYNIDPYEFEKLVADLWALQGYETEVSQASNDMGVDVIAEKSDAMVNTKLAIQVKRYSEGNDIGRGDVQRYHSMKVQDSTVDGAVIVTTSRYRANP